MNIIKKYVEINLIVKILIGLIIGVVLGLLVPQATGISFIGDLFISTLKAIAPFLVFFIIIAAIANAKGNLGARFGRVIVLYIFSMVLAAIVAVSLSFLFPVTLPLSGKAAVSAATAAAPQGVLEILGNLIKDMVSNPVDALLNAKYISILFWSIIFGFSLKAVANKEVLNVFSAISDMISKCIRGIIQLAPFGIMGIVFGAVSQNGLSIFINYGQLICVLVGAIAIVAFITDPLLSGLVLRRNPYPLTLTCLRESGITAFFTRSSAANIPINMRLCERLGLDIDFYGVSIPLGSTINMEGATVTITVMTLAVCHTMGIEVGFLTALVLCLVSIIGACGASGIAGGSLLLIPMACSLFGVPADVAMYAVGVGFIIGVIQDSAETALNSAGDAIFTATAEYKQREVEGREVNFLGEFAK